MAIETSNTINSALNLVPLDFVTLKNNFKTYLKSQALFKDYNFDGSNFSVLIDLLTYNTFYNAWYLNMVASEMFLDSCQNFDSSTSHAKELNYLPRSTQSAEIDTDIIINTGNTSLTSFVIPKYTQFYGRIGSNVYFFSTNSVVTASSTNNIVTAANVNLYEGSLVTEIYNVNYANTFQQFILDNANVDISSISVVVSSNNGASNLTYLQANSPFGLNSTSLVFFVQPTINSLYEVIFGDNSIGLTPPDNSLIITTYRVSSADAPNGLANIVSSGTIDGFSNISFNIINPAYNGSPRENIQSIKYNAPRSFETQDRAVVPIDFATLLQQNFPQISAIYAYGGDTLNPPQYGKVFIAVALAGITVLPQSAITNFTNFLANKAVATLTPVFINPIYINLYVYSTVTYNVNISAVTPSTIRSEVINAISSFSNNNLNDFATDFYYSQFVTAISNADPSILSNQTNVKMISYITPIAGTVATTGNSTAVSTRTVNYPSNTYSANFGQAINLNQISSSVFLSNGANSEITSLYTKTISNVVSNGTTNTTVSNYIGIIRQLNISTGIYSNIGNVNFTTGYLQFTTTISQDTPLKIYAPPAALDITSGQNVILIISNSDIVVVVDQVSV